MDIENFPTSAGARRMLSYVTAGWYENSYVGKWVYQVMGLEADEARRIFEELPAQFFVDLATWGLRYHERKYGLPIREELPSEIRRMLIKEKRDLKYSMNPYRMEEILAERFGTEVHVFDTNDTGGFVFAHPNILLVQFAQDGRSEMLQMEEVQAYIDKIKLSHTTYDIYYLFRIWAGWRVSYQSRMLFFMDVKGPLLLCKTAQSCFGAVMYEAGAFCTAVKSGMEAAVALEGGAGLVLEGRVSVPVKEGASALSMEWELAAPVECNGSLRVVQNEWYIDGSYLLNGEKILNARDFVMEL